jgi:hypothetical protein
MARPSPRIILFFCNTGTSTVVQQADCSDLRDAHAYQVSSLHRIGTAVVKNTFGKSFRSGAAFCVVMLSYARSIAAINRLEGVESLCAWTLRADSQQNAMLFNACFVPYMLISRHRPYLLRTKCFGNKNAKYLYSCLDNLHIFYTSYYITVCV